MDSLGKIRTTLSCLTRLSLSGKPGAYKCNMQANAMYMCFRYTQLQDMVSSQGEQLAKLKSETQLQIEARESETNKAKAELKEAKERLQATKENNRKILTSNQQLREK